MKENELKRELELYKKMYYSLFNATTDAIKICENDTMSLQFWRTKLYENKVFSHVLLVFK